LKGVDAWGGTFFEIGQHSPIAGIRKGIQQYTENGCDSIIAVGGGSPVDASKAMLYFIQQEQGGKTPPQIAIPTTLSAAEYSVRFLRILCVVSYMSLKPCRLAPDIPMRKGTKWLSPRRSSLLQALY
jgi:hypothetical protein